jgi:hypothetical protein
MTTDTIDHQESICQEIQEFYRDFASLVQRYYIVDKIGEGKPAWRKKLPAVHTLYTSMPGSVHGRRSGNDAAGLGPLGGGSDLRARDPTDHCLPCIGTFSSVYKAIDLLHYHHDNAAWCRKHLSADMRRIHMLSTDDWEMETLAEIHECAVVALKRIYAVSSPTRIWNEIAILHHLR